MKIAYLTIAVFLLATNFSHAQEEPAENASNPLAAVSNTDLRLKSFDLEAGDRQEFFLDGATMLNPKLKLKYEAHWWDTDVPPGRASSRLRRPRHRRRQGPNPTPNGSALRK